MAIEFSCPDCGKKYKVADESAGRRAKCGCGKSLTVPPGQSSLVVAETVPAVLAPARTHSLLGKGAHTTPWHDRKSLVIFLLVIFFPVGLYALWKSAVFRSRTKFLVTSGIGMLLIVAATQSAMTKRDLARADSLWAEGKKDEAISSYKKLLDSSVDMLAESRRPILFQRVIENEIQNHNQSTAQYFIDKAVARNVPLAFADKEAASMFEKAKLDSVAQAHRTSTAKPKTSPASGLSVDEFRDRIIGRDYIPKSNFYDQFGKPAQTTTIGSDTWLIFECQDGEARVKCPSGPFQYQDDIAPVAVEQLR